MSGMVWEDPPPAHPSQRGAPAQWPVRLRPLVEHPGRWAKVCHYRGYNSARESARKITSGQLPLVLGTWEAVARYTDPDDRTKGADLYVRYCGDGA